MENNNVSNDWREIIELLTKDIPAWKLWLIDKKTDLIVWWWSHYIKLKNKINGKVCCNCRHCIRTELGDSIQCHCDISGERQGYLTVMTYWCRHWSRETKWDKQIGGNADGHDKTGKDQNS